MLWKCDRRLAKRHSRPTNRDQQNLSLVWLAMEMMATSPLQADWLNRVFASLSLSLSLLSYSLCLGLSFEGGSMAGRWDTWPTNLAPLLHEHHFNVSLPLAPSETNFKKHFPGWACPLDHRSGAPVLDIHSVISPSPNSGSDPAFFSSLSRCAQWRNFGLKSEGTKHNLTWCTYKVGVLPPSPNRWGSGPPRAPPP